ncbi:hypothetical protein AB0G60_26625 [Streptomyces angustmyceticus]|uniref:Uncharacterized protein n=1 Tax=Streptomyces angustmyceticus TaxID=285578 RepID=A0A5J4LPY3_9ACTN|nr:hypothetical protein [Streptomyces angustmyceticus]GES33616.1 hypothetical protein San01_61040 [Streptomyces angustmyceticus]
MGRFLAAAAGFPTLVFTSALVMAVVFWLLVAAGVTESGSFDADVDLDARGLGGVPVTVAFSTMTVLAWTVSVSGTVLLDPVVSPGVGRVLVRLAVAVAALLVAWRVTRLLVRPLHRLFPDRPAPPRADSVGLTCTIRTRRADTGAGLVEATARDGSTATLRATGGAQNL